jgi:uncharacterized membrane protein
LTLLGFQISERTYELQISIVAVVCIVTLYFRLEPFVCQQIKKAMRIKSDRKSSHSDESLNSFLNSALNIEFVCLILASVRSLAYMDSNISKRSRKSSKI